MMLGAGSLHFKMALKKRSLEIILKNVFSIPKHYLVQTVYSYISIYMHNCILTYAYIHTYNSKYTSTTHNEIKIQSYINQLLPVDFFSHNWLMCLFMLQP